MSQENRETAILEGEQDEKLMAEIQHNPGALSSFVILFYGYMSSPLDYDGKQITAIELSILMEIIRNPGITATQLAYRWRRTKGAVSQILTKLESKDLICRTKSETDNKVVYIYPTAQGTDIGRIYYESDLKDTPKIIRSLLKNCTLEEIKSFYKVVEHYSEIIINKEVL